jgi:hypothetical protein
MGQIFTINSVFDFERKCLDRNKEIVCWIDNKLGIVIPGDKIRERLLVFYKQIVESFISNSEFIVDSLQKHENIEPVSNITRTVIELYCRAMYLNKVQDEEKIKKLVGIDFYTIALYEIDTETSSDVIKESEVTAKSFKFTLPSMEKLKDWIRKDIVNLGKSEELNKFRQEFWFPRVKRIIKDYLDENEEPKIPKWILYKYYSLVSDQIHGNPYFGQHVPDMSPRNRTLGLLITLNLRFLREISELTNFPRDKVDSLVLSWEKYFRSYFLDLWGSF